MSPARDGRVVVTGGAGFLGSHLCRRLLADGFEVVILDSMITGNDDNLSDLTGRPGFTFERRDVTDPIEVDGDVDWVLHFASPASPVDYQNHPIETLRVGALGTLNALELARARGASFLQASTSEVYGDPQVHPQPESYWGNVNPIGPRAVYDEAKRFGEAATTAYQRMHDLDIRIIRIFNTFGPAMRRNDGRAIPNFISQALEGRPITVHGDGTQTRSLCYVDDLIEAIRRTMSSDLRDPVNLGNPEEVTILELAERVRAAAGSKSEIVFVERPVDDPELRRPDISRARAELGWEPQISLHDGLARTVAWARAAWGEGAHGT